MIELTESYIISQVLILIVYMALITTYFVNNRFKILIFNIIAHIAQAASFFLLGGFTGVAMNGVYMIRDIFFVYYTKTNQSKKITKRDIGILIFFFLVIIILTIFTYNGPLSLLSVLATLISTYALWQKNPKIYKLLGIPGSLLWLGYHISLKSILAIILESILLISVIIGNIKNKKK